uniref:BZIP domain-containing protein n=1 Tax=Kalanchoe fedtschenkoi TaxID=63787 RepID=A0A7N0R8G8_KALFE
MPIDEWRRTAAAEDALVADLLLRLKHSRDTWTAATAGVTKAVVASVTSSGGLAAFRWGRRRARSRPGAARFVMNKEYKDRDTRSPTTPLSWSGGGASVSVSGNGVADGCEASSMMCCRSSASRSKISAYSLANCKRVKRRKTYIELKEEEGSLLQERQNLRRDLATMRDTLTDHRMTNENLKRIKSMNVQSRSMTTSAVAENPFVYLPTSTKTSTIQGMPLALKPHDAIIETPAPLPHSFSLCDAPVAKDRESFMLPDLNMLPSIDEESF